MKKRSRSAAPGRKTKGKSPASAKGPDPKELLAQALAEISLLRQELAMRDATVASLRARLSQERDDTECQRRLVALTIDDKQEICASMSTDFTRRQRDCRNEFEAMRNELIELRKSYEKCVSSAEAARASYELRLQAKETALEEATSKISFMAADFETSLNDTMDKVARRLQATYEKWTLPEDAESDLLFK